MKIAIEAQRIFRKEKHGMDYVALETIREIQKIDRQNEYFILVSPGEDRCLQGQYAYRTDRLPILPFVGANRTAVNPEKDTA